MCIRDRLYDEGFVLILPEAKAPDVLPEFQPQEKIFQVQKDSEEWGRKLEISTVGELNDQIVSQGIQKILLMQEAIQESGIARIAEQIVAVSYTHLSYPYDCLQSQTW